MSPVRNVSKKGLLATMFALLLSGCGGSGGGSQPYVNQSLDMTLLHMNDHHAQLEETDITLTLDGDEYEMKSGGFPRVIQAFKDLELSATHANILKLHAGDAIAGSRYATLLEGEADAAMMNMICFDAFVPGVHEFDRSDLGLKTFLDFLNPSEATQCVEKTPVLAANITPRSGTPLAAGDYLKPYDIKYFNNEPVGIIGLLKKETTTTSHPQSTTEFADELTTVNSVVEVLEAQGINKIILVSHYGYKNDQLLAGQLSGVDVIVGGDSHSLLGDFSGLGLDTDGEYPTRVTDSDGNPVCIVQAWQYAQVVGELNVSLDANGIVTNCAGTAHLLVENPSEKNGEDITQNGDALDSVERLMDAHRNLAVTSEDTAAMTALLSYKQQFPTLNEQLLGEAQENLCMERLPGEGRSTLCSASETLPHGGDIQTLVTHAFREMVSTAHISIQNAGRIRNDVPMGDITIGDVYDLLPFGNTLVTMRVTGQDVKDVLEDAVDHALSGATGAYPYAAGLHFDVDVSQPKGARISNLQYKGTDDEFWSDLLMAAQYTVVTNNYIAAGNEGYDTFASISADKQTDTYLEYAETFVNYLNRLGGGDIILQKLSYKDYSTQRFTDANGDLYVEKWTDGE